MERKSSGAWSKMRRAYISAKLETQPIGVSDNTALADTASYQSHEKALNAIYLATIAQGNDNIDSSQITSLLTIAGKCPLSDGRAVHYARSLYQMVADSTFSDHCTVPPASPQGENVSSTVTELHEEGAIHIYPNPASNEIIIEGKCTKLEVFHQNGQLMLSRELDEGMQQQKLNLSNLTNGVYLLKVYQDNVSPSVHKLVIICPL